MPSRKAPLDATADNVKFLPMRQLQTMCSLCMGIVLAGAATAHSQTTMIGKDLTGWVSRGGKAIYSIEGGELVGTAVLNSPNSFLCTEKTYGDFVLEYDFKVDPRLNSGVQIRSECFAEKTEVEWRGKKINVPAGRVHGYQIEIDPDPKRDRWWTAGIYDEGRRDWLFPGVLGGNGKEFTEIGRKLFKRGDWNHIRVEALGDSIKTWLNDTPCAEVSDAMTPRGLIGLQVHGVGKEAAGAQVRWRNLMITELTQAPNTLSNSEKAEGWKLLWNGASSNGWRSAKSETFPNKGWTMQDGVLSVIASGGKESASGGDIITRERYDAFELVVDFKIAEGTNSGVKIFVQPNLDPITGTGAKTSTGSAIGLEYQILDDLRHPDAKLGHDGNRKLGAVYDLIPASTDKHPNPIGEWNTARIVSKGKHVEHWLNGAKIAEYDRGSEAFRGYVAHSKFKSIPGFGEWSDGHILLQDHGDRVSFRNIKIRVLR